jgi:hypothetical protein
MTGNTGLRRLTKPNNRGPHSRRNGTGPSLRVVERCEMCSTPLEERHGHVVDTQQRTLACTCRACYLLFSARGAGSNRFCAVPDRVLHDPDHRLSEPDWEALEIPVGTAFFFANSSLSTIVASYPSSAGATESDLDAEQWNRLARAYPLLRALDADTEAIFVHRAHDGFDTYLVPIDLCYAYLGEVRQAWLGLDGGDGVRTVTTRFLADLSERSRPLEPPPG